MLEKVNEILDFWLGREKQNPLSHAHLWWQADPLFDKEIRERFEPLLQLAVQGKLSHWMELPQSCLAYIILLDQFSRNMYRNTQLAFAQDHLARAACEHGRQHKLDKELGLIQRLFFYMPLEHSEFIEDQNLSVVLFGHLVTEAKEHQPLLLNTMEQALDYAQKHYDVIRNFGRFPHRNLILDRESTQEELVFLSLPQCYF